MKRLLIPLGLVCLGCAGASQAQQPEYVGPTCSDTLGIDVHGQHIIGDYVTGLGAHDMAWPPSGGVVGDAIRENDGPIVVGGPGPGFHFKYGVAPGASFCNDSNSPGAHF